MGSGNVTKEAFNLLNFHGEPLSYHSISSYFLLAIKPLEEDLKSFKLFFVQILK